MQNRERDAVEQGDENRQYGNRADDGIKLTTAFGSIQAHGPMVVALVLAVCAVVVIAFMQRDHDLRTGDTLKKMADIRSDQVKSLADQQARIEEKMDNLVYVIALPENQRAALKLNMPTALRQQLLTQERAR